MGLVHMDLGALNLWRNQPREITGKRGKTKQIKTAHNFDLDRKKQNSNSLKHTGGVENVLDLLAKKEGLGHTLQW